MGALALLTPKLGFRPRATRQVTLCGLQRVTESHLTVAGSPGDSEIGLARQRASESVPGAISPAYGVGCAPWLFSPV